ncbi:hypothetical protein FHX15_004596 [Rhizobium sp. BK650]|nr:hypothetical protein [Rhizobium sp. BK650]
MNDDASNIIPATGAAQFPRFSLSGTVTEIDLPEAYDFAFVSKYIVSLKGRPASDYTRVQAKVRSTEYTVYQYILVVRPTSFSR